MEKDLINVQIKYIKNNTEIKNILETKNSIDQIRSNLIIPNNKGIIDNNPTTKSLKENNNNNLININIKNNLTYVET